MRLFTLLCVLALASREAPAVEWATRTTENFSLQYDASQVSEGEVDLAARRGERFRAAIEAMLGHAPEQKIVVILHGPSLRPDGSRGTPRVDGFGRVHLFRFGPEPESSFGAYAHELVHVFRLHRMPHEDWFTEEGFAEFVARRVDDGMHGFPWYGETMDLVAGHLVTRGEAIALDDLRARHQELNMPCRLQSYALRASFFDWLGTTFGDEAVVAFAQEERAGSLENYAEFFGAHFDALAARWEKELRARFESLADASARADAYRTQTPAQWIPICDPTQ